MVRTLSISDIIITATYNCSSDFPVMFERSSYVFTEGAGQASTDIALVKDDTVETELNLSVLVNVSSARGTAELGMDYNMLYNLNACTSPMLSVYISYRY